MSGFDVRETGRPEPAAEARILRWAIVGACLGWLIIGSWLRTETWPIPGTWDEIQHVSYAAEVAEADHIPLTPHRLLDVVAQDEGKGFAWTGEVNYLSHPPLYYWLLSPFASAGDDLATLVRTLRKVSLVLVGTGVALAILALYPWLPTTRSLAVFALALSACPMLMVSAAQVTNDALAVFAGCLTIAGAAWCGTGSTFSRRGPVILALALFLAGWAKANALLLIATFVAVFLLLNRHRRGARRAFAISGIGVAAGALPTLLNLWLMGRPISIVREDLVAADVPDPSWLEYLPRFLEMFGRTWHISQPGHDASLAAVYLVLGIALAAPLRLGPVQTTPPLRRIAQSAATAFLLTLPIHFAIALLVAHGSLPAAAFRYALPLWPGLCVALAFGALSTSGRARVIVTLSVVAALVLGVV